MGKENPLFFDDGIYRFVILHHTGAPQRGLSGGRGDHWDWMFDWPSERFGHGVLGPEGGTAGDFAAGTGPLVTFSSTQSPAEWDSGSEFEALPLHRRRYLDYEGPISGNRGQVERVASGRLRWLRMACKELAWSVESVDFLVQPSRDWVGTSYCLEEQGPGDGCPKVGMNAPDSIQELPHWLVCDPNATSATRDADRPRWVLRRLAREGP